MKQPATAQQLEAAATLYHAWYTGLILAVTLEKGPKAVGEWTRRTFYRQHKAKFLPAFEKLGLTGLSHAVACARYHCLSNQIGGVEVEYMEESDRKAWVRFPHPRWIYDGTAICGVPASVGHGYMRGWYAQNGISLENPRLGFVCVSEDTKAQIGFTGYFIEEDRDLADGERLRFRPDETPPPFDANAAPKLDPAVWTPERLIAANRNYALEYVANGLPELLAQFGDDGVEIARHSAMLIGRQYYRRLQTILGLEGNDVVSFGAFMKAMAKGSGDDADFGGIIVDWYGWRLMREESPPPAGAFHAWCGLWEGCLSTHNRQTQLHVEREDDGATFQIGDLE